jgi:hypothetical protein
MISDKMIQRWVSPFVRLFVDLEGRKMARELAVLYEE